MATIFTNQTIVAFHVGRGGRFNNPGHVEFLGRHVISEYALATYDLEAPATREPGAEWKDLNGSKVGMTNEMFDTGVGYINFDGPYDTTYTMRMGDIEEDSKEWEAIFGANSWLDADEAREFLREKFIND